ncbi:T-cell surface glycoprotein CD3 delta chain-like isoform X2 [Xiphias gladius]|nr:T-cell surface glycoprotein CD3 delta chain-like isoform X2 [Xiphias gladius]XP_039987758.1 T-cell surface glycoprotein CD3 delta chain-like isoform X2 [Xiphias gladius]XP_039987759.1 T-cell surface glycoprotein CD3 delta chain-like isoform X2 [Xiphias gladius]
MQSQVFLPACLLLLWTLTENALTVKVTTVGDGIKLVCEDEGEFLNHDGSSLYLPYSDENSREYSCNNTTNGKLQQIFVKFRTCDNCVELDTASIFGLAIGDVVATIAIGLAVYLIASHAQTGPITSHKKSSDRQHLVPNEVSSRAPNDHYQRLRHKGGQRDTYDVINNKK